MCSEELEAEDQEGEGRNNATGKASKCNKRWKGGPRWETSRCIYPRMLRLAWPLDAAKPPFAT